MNNTSPFSPEEKVYAMYGAEPPVQVLGRLVMERKVLYREYFLDRQLVDQLMEEAEKDGTDVSVAGAYGASFISWLNGHTPVNPLPPHYFYPREKTAVFFQGEDCGELPALYPEGETVAPDGHNIPVEMLQAGMETNKLGLTIRIAESFADRAEQIVKENYKDRWTAVRYGSQFTRFGRSYALIPKDRELPELDENGIWQTRAEEIYKSGFRTISLDFDSQKEQIRKLKAGADRDPVQEDLLAKPVMALAAAKLEEDILKEGGKLLRPEEELSFSSLLRLLGYMKSTHTECNPVFREEGASYTDLFTCREQVWRLVREKLTEETGVSPDFARVVAESTRKGAYAGNRMKPETERLLRGLGIEERWITQMKETMYLWGKADLIIWLLDLLKLSWYELRAGVYGGRDGSYCFHEGELRPSDDYRKRYGIPDHPIDGWYEEDYRVWNDPEVFLEKRVCRECGKEFTLPDAMERCRRKFEHVPYLYQFRGDVCGDCAAEEYDSKLVKDV